MDIGIPVHVLRIKEYFEKLSNEEQLFAHHMSRAAFHGARIAMQQVSPESESVFDLIIEVFKACDGDMYELASRCGVQSDTVEALFEYGASVLNNLGNYEGCGSHKIIPRISPDLFRLLCSISEKAKKILSRIEKAIYSPEPGFIGFSDAGLMSNLYPDSDISKEQIRFVGQVLSENGILFQNTRLRKTNTGESITFEVLIGSVNPKGPHRDLVLELPQHQGNIVFIYGDHSTQLLKVTGSLTQALKYTKNQDEYLFIEKTIEYLRTGDVELHKQACIPWLQNADPSVETWIGFLDMYTDPISQRWIWGGLVCIPGESKSKALKALEKRVPEFVGCLPWAKLGDGSPEEPYGPFEKTSFKLPNFKSVEILTYCVREVWWGISEPSYGDIEETHGRKLLCLDNRLKGQNISRNIPFLKPEDLPNYRRLRDLSLSTILIGHELIGRGVGKELAQTGSSTYNFDIENPPLDPVTGKPITTWYKPGENQKHVFGAIGSAYSECVAEGIGIYLLSKYEMLHTLGVAGSGTSVDEEDLIYIGYLQEVYMGIMALTSYDPTTKKWGQDHDRARFAILKHLHLTCPSLLIITHTPPTKYASPNLTISLSRPLISTLARPALGSLLQEMHIYKCTADVQAATSLFERLTTVDGEFEKWREAAVKREPKRPVFVQANTLLKMEVDERGGKRERVEVREYEDNMVGVVRSWVEREI